MQEQGGVGAYSPREIRCSEIASKAIWGQKQAQQLYMARGVLHPISGCPCMHLLSQGISTREGTTVGRTAGDITKKTTGENLQRLKQQFIYACIYTHPFITAVLHEQIRIAATRSVLTAVILNSCETSEPLSNSRALKMCS